MADPVGPEFALVSREISLGLSPAVAMANLQARMDAQDLPVFVTAVLVQLEAGGNLAETLDNLGEVVRQRLLFYGKVKALDRAGRRVREHPRRRSVRDLRRAPQHEPGVRRADAEPPGRAVHARRRGRAW